MLNLETAEEATYLLQLMQHDPTKTQLWVCEAMWVTVYPIH